MVKGAMNGQDDVFVAGEPESLLYEPDSTVPGGWRLAGAMWIMPIDQVPLVPEGFVGNEDAWHYHLGLCFLNASTVIAENTTQAQCFGMGGTIWVEKAGWLVHLWAYHLNPAGRFVEVNNALTQAPASGSSTIAIDANPSIGGIQTSAAATGGSVVVDVVGMNLANVAAFNFDLEYDPAVFSGPTVGAGASTDRNPDANQTFLDSTGRAFSCDMPSPNGAVTSGTKKAARISCYSTGGTSTPGPNTGAGSVLASVTLNVIGNAGSGSALALKNVNVFNATLSEIASCAPTQSITATCSGASITSSAADADSDGVPDTSDNCPNTANANQQDTDADMLGNACEPSYGTNMNIADTDGDGCKDGVEARPLAFAPQNGGDRNPTRMWDFFDLTGNRTIDLSDTLSVLQYFGDPGTSPQANLRDRAVPSMLKPWQLVEANNGVDLQDALNNLSSFGHSCT
jgi:hypothetical protein